MDGFVSGPFLFVIVLLVLAGVLVRAAVKMVPQGYEWTVERFGRFTTTLPPGLHIIIPVVDRIGRRVSVQEQVLDVPAQEVITRDNAIVRCDGVVFFQVVDAALAAYEVRNLTHAITNLSMTNIRSVIGSMDLDETLSNRDSINDRLLKVVDAATNPWGVKVTRIEIKDLQPPPDISDAMARQMKAERLRRAQILEAEGDKQSSILRAEGQKQAAILEAEGRKEAAFRDAEAREREAAAEGEATRLVSEAIAAGDMGAINYFVANNYVEALKGIATADNNKLIMLPLEATGVMGSLAGVAEIARDAFGGRGDAGGGNSGRGGKHDGGPDTGGSDGGGSDGGGSSLPPAGGGSHVGGGPWTR